MRPPRCWLPIRYLAPVLVALLAGALVASAVDPAGSYPRAAEGPGLTLDEIFNVEQGVRLVRLLPEWLLGRLTSKEVFGEPEDLGPAAPLGYHLPDHPPLGRFLLGAAHEIALSIRTPNDPGSPFVTACARTGSAAAFALLALLVGCVASNWYGWRGGTIAAVSLILMPRLFGHAHLAALETFLGLTYAAAVLSVAAKWGGARPPGWKTSLWTGAIFGLALLSKIQAVLLPLPVAVWALFHWRAKAIWPVCLWGLAGVIVFFVGWPWLWLDPTEHLKEYLGRTADRKPLNVWYLGRQFVDLDVPWHYPWVMFLTTVPLGLHLVGLAGVFGGDKPAWSGRREQLVLACLAFPLLVFSLPGVAVYDGSRLFLVVFPLWALLVGRGYGPADAWLRNRVPPAVAVAALLLFFALQAYGIVRYRPCYLSYYNLSVGGLSGADRLGFERTYWGDSITREMLHDVVRRVPEETTIAVAPVLHPFQLEEMGRQSPILRRHGIRLVAYDPSQPTPASFLLVFHRMADLSDALRERLTQWPADVEVRREGVRLAALYELP